LRGPQPQRSHLPAHRKEEIKCHKDSRVVLPLHTEELLVQGGELHVRLSQFKAVEDVEVLGVKVAHDPGDLVELRDHRLVLPLIMT